MKRSGLRADPGKVRAWQDRPRKPLKRSPIARSTKPIARYVKVKAVNTKRQARRQKTYSAHLRSPYWQDIRRKAYERDGGLCQCHDCIKGRKDGVADAFEPIEIWFDKKGKIHGFDTHHVTYTRFGQELLEDVLTMRPACHRRLEAKTGIRKRFLARSG